MVLLLSVSNLFFCMTASDSHRFAHWDAPYKIEILQYDLETLNQLVTLTLTLTGSFPPSAIGDISANIITILEIIVAMPFAKNKRLIKARCSVKHKIL